MRVRLTRTYVAEGEEAEIQYLLEHSVFVGQGQRMPIGEGTGMQTLTVNRIEKQLTTGQWQETTWPIE